MQIPNRSFQWQPCGSRAALVTFCGDGAWDTVATAANELHADPNSRVVDATPAFDKLLIEFADAEEYRTQITQTIDSLRVGESRAQQAPRLHHIPVRYDGEDLAYVAECVALPVSEVVRLHQFPVYQVALLGFSPGFPYLEGLPPALHTPRRSTPRPCVPVGSVAIGGSHTGVYSLATPAGWNLIGTTSLRLFDLGRIASPQSEAAAFFLKPGDHVKFVAE